MTTENYTFDETGSSTEIEDLVDSNNVLDKLRAIVQEEVRRPDIEIPVPERQGVSVVFSPNIDSKRLKRLRKLSGAESRNGLDPLKFASYVIAETTTQILVKGEVAQNDDAINLNFASLEILEMTEAGDPLEAVQKFFGLDPHVESAALKILESAGYSDELDEADPTAGLLTD